MGAKVILNIDKVKVYFAKKKIKEDYIKHISV